MRRRFASVAMGEWHLVSAVCYVSLNPVRARLATRAEDWPWSSVRAHMNGADDGLVTVRPVLDRIPNFAALLSTTEDQDFVTVGLIAPAPRPDGDSVGMTDARNRGRQLVPVTGKLLPNRRQESSILQFLDLGLVLVDLAQLHLIERWIGRNGHRVPVRFHREFEVRFARHDDMHSIELRGDGEFIRRIQSRLRRHKRPGANARISRSGIRFSSKWNDENKCEQRECADGSS
jgi:hypothetical protein